MPEPKSPGAPITDGTTNSPEASRSIGLTSANTPPALPPPPPAGRTSPGLPPVSAHPRFDALIAAAPSVGQAASGLELSSSGQTPLVFPLPPLDPAWEHPLFPVDNVVERPKPPPTPVPPIGGASAATSAATSAAVDARALSASRPIDVVAAVIIDLAVLGLLGHLVSRGHLRIDFAGIMALVGLVLHHRRAVPVLPRLFPR